MRRKEKYQFYGVKLTGIMVLVFIVQVVFSGFTETFVLTPEAFTQWWRFVSALFLHGGLAHLMYNSFALLLFGSILESLIGGRRVLLVFFGTGIVANVFSVLFYPSSLGASGAIFGIIGTLIVMRPLLPVFAFGLPMPIIVAGILWGIGDILGAIGFLTGNPIDNTGNFAHLAGMVIGFLCGWVFREPRTKVRDTRVHVSDEAIEKWERGYLGR